MGNIPIDRTPNCSQAIILRLYHHGFIDHWFPLFFVGFNRKPSNLHKSHCIHRYSPLPGPVRMKAKSWASPLWSSDGCFFGWELDFGRRSKFVSSINKWLFSYGVLWFNYPQRGIHIANSRKTQQNTAKWSNCKASGEKYGFWRDKLAVGFWFTLRWHRWG